MSVEEKVKALKLYLLKNGPQPLPKLCYNKEKLTQFDRAIESESEIFLDYERKSVYLPGIERACFQTLGKLKSSKSISSIIDKLKQPKILKAYPFLERKTRDELLFIFIEHAFNSNLLVWGDKLFFGKDVHDSKQRIPTMSDYKKLYEIKKNFKKNRYRILTMKDVEKIDRTWPAVIGKNPIFFNVNQSIKENKDAFVFDLDAEGKVTEATSVPYLDKELLTSVSKALLSVYLMHYLRSKCIGKVPVAQIMTAINEKSPVQIFHNKISTNEEIIEFLRNIFPDKIQFQNVNGNTLVSIKENPTWEKLWAEILCEIEEERKDKKVAHHEPLKNLNEKEPEESEAALEGFMKISRVKKHFQPEKSVEQPKPITKKLKTTTSKSNPQNSSRNNSKARSANHGQAKSNPAQKKKESYLQYRNYEKQKNPKYRQAIKKQLAYQSFTQTRPPNDRRVTAVTRNSNSKTKTSYSQFVRKSHTPTQKLPPPFPDYTGPKNEKSNTFILEQRKNTIHNLNKTSLASTNGSMSRNFPTNSFNELSNKKTKQNVTPGLSSTLQSETKSLKQAFAVNKKHSFLTETPTAEINKFFSLKINASETLPSKKSKQSSKTFERKPGITTLTSPTSKNFQTSSTGENRLIETTVGEKNRSLLPFKTKKIESTAIFSESISTIRKKIDHETCQEASKSFIGSHEEKQHKPLVYIDESSAEKFAGQANMQEQQSAKNIFQTKKETSIFQSPTLAHDAAQDSSEKREILLNKKDLVSSTLDENKIHINIMFLRCQQKQNMFNSIHEMLAYVGKENQFKIDDCWVERRF